MAPVMTFFQILPAQIGLPTRGGSVNLAPHRNPAWPYGHSHLAWWPAINHRKAKRDSGGVRGIPIPSRVGSPIWVGNF